MNVSQEAIARLSNATFALSMWLEDSYAGEPCNAGNHDGGSTYTCEHCIVQRMVKEADEAREVVEHLLIASMTTVPAAGRPAREGEGE